MLAMSQDEFNTLFNAIERASKAAEQLRQNRFWRIRSSGQYFRTAASVK
jgi:hypothetical protein